MPVSRVSTSSCDVSRTQEGSGSGGGVPGQAGAGSRTSATSDSGPPVPGRPLGTVTTWSALKAEARPYLGSSPRVIGAGAAIA